MKIDGGFQKLRSQMYCHLFMVHSVVGFSSSFDRRQGVM